MNECPKCGYARTTTDTTPSGECPRCGVIYSKVRAIKPESYQSSPRPEEISEVKVEPQPTLNTPNNLDAQQKKYLIAALIIGLVFGYFAGREHVKYQIRSTITEAAFEIKKTIGTVFGGAPPTKEPGKKSPTKSPEKIVKPDAPPPITAALVKKGFYNGEYGRGEITFTVQFTSSTEKNVRAFDGVLNFTDLLDNEIMSAKLAVNDPVGAGHTFDWNGSIDYNQFMDKHQRLKSADQQNIKITFALRKILFEDGEVKEF
ncbi:MAG: hypothetical protein KJ630_01270 [Proteobacteria bacterium]|nr:hypothetical protein [Pseudomonadota bacterium]